MKFWKLRQTVMERKKEIIQTFEIPPWQAERLKKVARLFVRIVRSG